VRDYWVFVLYPLSGVLKNTAFWKLDLLPSSCEGIDIQRLRLVLSNGPEKDVSHHWNTPSFRKICFIRIVNKFQITNNLECYALPLILFRIHVKNCLSVSRTGELAYWSQSLAIDVTK
jgi:hypothetical protein